MWGLYGFAEGNWTPKPPDPLGSGRERSYNCRACLVHGKGTDDGSLTCWCCDSADHLDIDKTVAILNAHTWAAREADGDTLEAVGSLVG